MTVDMSDLQARIDAENEKGYRGARIDPNPNSAYSQESDPMTSPRAPRHGSDFVIIDEYADPDNPYIEDIHNRTGLDDADVAAEGLRTVTGTIPAQATAGTAGANKTLGKSPVDGTATGATITPVGTITGHADNNRTFKVYNKTADHPLFTVTTTATKTGGAASALAADGSDQTVSQDDVLEVRQTVAGTGVAHTGASFTVSITAQDSQ